MVIAWSKREDASKFAGLSAWQRVEKAEAEIELPCLLVPQPAHSALAGELASALLPSGFGELPPAIHQAITLHDTGWAMLDAAQIQRLRSDSPREKRAKPVAFLSNSPQETVEAWTASISSVERVSPLGGLVVSRHFTFLARPEVREQKRFAELEGNRQRMLAGKLQAAPEDLARWTAALGFCDLLALYLLTGLRTETTFPVAHPASPEAESAERVTLEFEGNRIHFNPVIFETNVEVEIEGLRHPVAAGGARAERLSWEIV